MRKKLIFGVLFVIVLLAASVRLYNLSNTPPGPHLDEISNGYNAYSILNTGKDEYGKQLPLLLQAYNDYRPALFVYSIIPFIKVFGLTAFAIRLPAVLFNIAAIISLFFLIKMMIVALHEKRTNDKSFLFVKKNIDIIALSGTFLYAISPWNIYSSRLSNEVSISTSLFILALTFFFYWINNLRNQNKSRFSLFVSMIFFALTFYSYHGIKLFIPVFLFSLCVVFFKELWERKKIVILSVLFSGLLIIPIISSFNNPLTTLRIGAVNALKNNPQIAELASQRVLYDKTNNLIIDQLFDNRRALLLLEVAKNYFRNYDLSWLFTHTSNKSLQLPDFGPMYIFEFLIILLGIFILIKDNFIDKKIKFLLVIWILTATFPSALTNESPHLNRSNSLFPALIIIESFGLAFLVTRIWQTRNMLSKISSYIFLVSTVFFSFMWFLHAYFVLLPYDRAKAFQYGALEAMGYANDHENDYQTIIVSNANTLLDSYMYYLFVSKYDPKTYQKQGGTKSAFFTDEHFIGKYKFLDFDHYYGEDRYKNEKPTGRTLYVVNPGEVPQPVMDKKSISIIKKISFPDGTDSIWILEEKDNI